MTYYTILFDRTDNWENIPYHLRCFDALARFFGVDKPCASVVQINPDEYHIRFNSSLAVGTANHQKFLAIGACIPEQKLQKLVVLYLLTNAYAFPKMRLIDIEGIIPTTILNLDDVRVEGIWQNYLQHIMQPIEGEFTHLKFNLSIRAYQDVVKLVQHFGWEIPIPQILENPDGNHAELVHDDHMPYCGISKLCCAPCHIVLEERAVPHRGTHGIIEQNWRSTSPEQYHPNIRAREQQAVEGRYILQQHDLSDDEDIENSDQGFYSIKHMGEVVNIVMD